MAKPRRTTEWKLSVYDGVLWRNDLEDIVHVMNEAAGEWHALKMAPYKERWGENPPEDWKAPERVSVKIQDDANDFESLDDARTVAGPNPSTLTLSVRDSHRMCMVFIDTDGISVTATGAADLIGPFDRLRDIVLRHSKRRGPAATLLASAFLGWTRRHGAWLVMADEMPSFWANNRDKILLGFLLMIAGALVKPLFDWIMAAVR